MHNLQTTQRDWTGVVNAHVEKYRVPPRDAEWLQNIVRSTRQMWLPTCDYCNAILPERPQGKMRLREIPLFEVCTCPGARAECVARDARMAAKNPLPTMSSDGNVIFDGAGNRTHVRIEGEWRPVGNLQERIDACLPKALRSAVWEHFSRRGEHGAAIRCIERWMQRAVSNRADTWAYLYGENGCGKTSALACMAKDLLKAERDVLWLDWQDMLSMPFDALDALIARASTVDVLLLDEFGKGKLNEYTAVKAASLINRRMLNEATTVFASNFAPQDLIKNMGNDGIAIAERIEHKCDAPLNLTGYNYRRKAKP